MAFILLFRPLMWPRFTFNHNTPFLEIYRMKLPHETLETTILAGIILTIVLFVLIRVIIQS